MCRADSTGFSCWSSSHDPGEVQHECSWQSLQPALPETLPLLLSSCKYKEASPRRSFQYFFFISSVFSQFKRCHQGSVGEIQVGGKAALDDKSRVVSSHLKQTSVPCSEEELTFLFLPSWGDAASCWQSTNGWSWHSQAASLGLLQISDWPARNDHTAGLSELQGLQLPCRTTQLHLVFLMGFSVFTPWLHPANLCQSTGQLQSLGGVPVEFGGWWWSCWAQSPLQMAAGDKPSGTGGEHEEGELDTSPVPACTPQRARVFNCWEWVSPESPPEPASALEGTYTDQQWQEAPAGLAAGSGIRAQSGTWQCSSDLSSLKAKPCVFCSQFSGLDHFFYQLLLTVLSLKSRTHITVSWCFGFRPLTLDVVRIKGPNPLSRTSMSCLLSVIPCESFAPHTAALTGRMDTTCPWNNTSDVIKHKWPFWVQKSVKLPPHSK